MELPNGKERTPGRRAFECGGTSCGDPRGKRGEESCGPEGGTRVGIAQQDVRSLWIRCGLDQSPQEKTLRFSGEVLNSLGKRHFLKAVIWLINQRIKVQERMRRLRMVKKIRKVAR